MAPRGTRRQAQAFWVWMSQKCVSCTVAPSRLGGSFEGFQCCAVLALGHLLRLSQNSPTQHIVYWISAFMAIQRKQVAVAVWARYDVYDLNVAPSLAGAAHHFSMQGYPVTFQLPKRPRQRDWHRHHAPISCHSWVGDRAGSGRIRPRYFCIREIECLLDTGKTRLVPERAIGVVRPNYFSSMEQKRLFQLTENYSNIINKAFVYWVDVLRWKSGISTICRPEVVSYPYPANHYLVDACTGERFFSGITVLHATRERVVSKRHWKEAQKVLDLGQAVPLWHICIAEAGQQLQLGDQRRFILDLAIASETAMRHLTSKFIKEPINFEFQELVNSVSSSRIFDKFWKLGFNSLRWKSLKGDINNIKKVMTYRNHIMHRGWREEVPYKECRELLNSVDKFIFQVDQELSKKS